MRPLGLYIHWPFCAKICPYCDFAVAKAREVDPELWLKTFRADLDLLAPLVEKRPLVSIYLGGGTPSLIPMSVARGILSYADDLFGIQPGAEITFEANPTDAARFTEFASAGFNRLSLGVQSFHDDELQFLGRNHDSGLARTAVEQAARTFDRVSLDFIYALPDQSLTRWRDTLNAAFSTGAGHLSLYQLTIEPDTAFGKRAARGVLKPMHDDRCADFYDATQEWTANRGFPAYEVSNHAAPGQEAVHNALYWADADWLAIGPGAHGRLGPPSNRLATEGSRRVTGYPQLDGDQRLAVSKLSLLEHRLEVLGSGLRPTAGLDLARLGDDLERVVAAAAPFIEQGLVEVDDRKLVVRPKGRLLIDYLAAELSCALDGTDVRGA
ncbi:MAG: radical SAM family heme chaperone HemW [Pseudomonadota bacterium]